MVSQETFEYRRCPDCGLIFLSNIPDNLNAYYSGTYYCSPSFEKLKKVAKAENYQLAMIHQFVKAGRLLEVGPGFGIFAYQAKQAGFDVDVIEKERRCCEFLTDKIGVNAIQSDKPHEVLKSAKGYDVIALWQVIEHLPNPWEFLKNAALNLNSGGILLIATPNPSAFQFGFQGALWPHVDAPRHLCLIPVDLLIKYLEPLGLRPVMTDFNDKGAKSWNRFGWQRYLMNGFSNKWLQRLAFVLGYFVAMTMSFSDCKKGKGSAYTVIFRKSGSLN
jgi:SAM-dependent methyltransferase